MALSTASNGSRVSRIFSGGFVNRMIFIGLIALPAILFGVTLPELRIAMNNGSTPRVLAWSEVKDNRLDLVHGYVRVSGMLTPTLITETTKEEGEKEKTSNTYEVLYDKSTHAGLLVGHFGGHSTERSGDPTPVTLTGVLTEPEGGVLNKLPNLNPINVSQSCQLVEGKAPGNTGTLIAIAAGEVVGFIALAAFVIYRFTAGRRTAKAQQAIAAQTGTDWKGLRLDD